MYANVNIGNSTSGYKDVEIKFPTPFGDVPPEIDQTIVVNATVVLDAKNFPLDSTSDRYTVNVAKITKDGFIARVARLDGDSWDMDITLNYMANRCTIFS